MSERTQPDPADEIRAAPDALIEPRNVSDAGVWWGYGQDEEIVWEESCERLYGLEPGSFEGTHEAWLERVHPEDRDKVEQEWWDAMDQNRPFQMVYRIVRPDGEVRWIDARAVIFTDEDGTYERAVGVDTDITDRLERFQQVQVLDRVLRHNLRNDLNRVIGYADLIEEAASGSMAEDARRIQDACHELLAKARKQQTISRLLADEPEVKAVDLTELVAESIAEVEESTSAAVIHRDWEGPAVAKVNQTFEVAIGELLENAIDHHDREAAEITVSIAGAGDSVRVSVADDGPGIPSIEREIVTGARRIGPLQHASGLGLWLVSWIVQRSNGTISFEANDPRGTVVVIEVPAAADSDD